MIIGIGTDIIEIDRIEKNIKRNDAFLKKCFTAKENELFKIKNMRSEVIAGNFCVTEAVSKALGTGFRKFSINHIEVLRDELGKPYVNLYNECKKKADELGVKEIFVSISHNRTNAIAYVIMEGAE